MELSRTENEEDHKQVKNIENTGNVEEIKNNDDIRNLYNASYTRSGK